MRSHSFFLFKIIFYLGTFYCNEDSSVMLVMVEFCKDKFFFKGNPTGLFVLTAIKQHSECKYSA